MLTINKKCRFTILIMAFLASSYCFSQQEIMYKQIESTKLIMDVYYPEKMDTTIKYPAMVFFYGGGWNEGTIKQFEPHAKYFSKRGMVCFLVDYRVTNRQHSTPFESLKDAKSAMRYIKEHANTYSIDTLKIVAAGGSAGGHLAAATALIEDYNETTDNRSISCKPTALVLFNPVIDNGPGGYGYQRIGDSYKSFSPIHNIKKGAPPTILFLGTKDIYIPVETLKYYQTVMNKVGSKCELRLYEGKEHGFFNYNKFENYKNTISETDAFLQSIGYLKDTPKIEIE